MSNVFGYMDLFKSNHNGYMDLVSKLEKIHAIHNGPIIIINGDDFIVYDEYRNIFKWS